MVLLAVFGLFEANQTRKRDQLRRAATGIPGIILLTTTAQSSLHTVDLPRGCAALDQLDKLKQVGDLERAAAGA